MKIRRVGQPIAGRVSAQQENLLRAAVLDEADDARHAYLQWAGNVDWDEDFDDGTYRLLPQLFINLDGAGVEDATIGRLRGVYRRSWYRNQRFMSTLSVIASSLAAAGVDIVLLGDVALINGVYKKLGARYVTRLDLLVDPVSVADALDHLGKLGWVSEPLCDDDLRYLSYKELTNTDGELIRLYWHPLHKKCTDDSYSFSTFGVRQDNDTTRFRVPTHAGLLSHLVVSGYEAGDSRLLADIVGTYSIVSSGDVDWEAALRLADEYSFNLRLYSVCCYLRSKLSAPIPERVVHELADRNVNAPDRFERRLARRSAESPDTFFGPLTRLLAQYTRYTVGSGATQTIIKLPAFLRHHYRTRSIARIIATVFVNGARRIARLGTRAPVQSPSQIMESNRLGDNREL